MLITLFILLRRQSAGSILLEGNFRAKMSKYRPSASHIRQPLLYAALRGSLNEVREGYGRRLVAICRWFNCLCHEAQLERCEVQFRWKYRAVIASLSRAAPAPSKTFIPNAQQLWAEHPNWICFAQGLCRPWFVLLPSCHQRRLLRRKRRKIKNK